MFVSSVNEDNEGRKSEGGPGLTPNLSTKLIPAKIA